MIAKIRNGLILLFVAAVTTAVAVSQFTVLKTGWGNPSFVPRLWHKSILWALGFRVHVVGSVSPKRPLLIVANHVSWTDIGVLGSIADVSFIAKAQMQGWPLMGWSIATTPRRPRTACRAWRELSICAASGWSRP